MVEKKLCPWCCLPMKKSAEPKYEEEYGSKDVFFECPDCGAEEMETLPITRWDKYGKKAKAIGEVGK